MTCFWDGFTRGTVNFCEARLCSWIESPGIAWAGVVYVLIGLYLYSQKNRAFAFYAISMGVSSFLYHASHTFMFQAWDVGSMFLLSTGIALINLRRLDFKIPKYSFWLLMFVQVGLFLMLKGKSGSMILASGLVVYFVSEYVVMKRSLRIDYRWFKFTLVLFTMGVASLWMEHKSGLCNPDNHLFQWHAVWDSLCAFTYYTLHRHFKQDPA